MSRRKHTRSAKPPHPAQQRHDPAQGRKNRGPERPSGEGGQRLYGLHAVATALRNPRRHIKHLWLTDSGEKALTDMPEVAAAITEIPTTRMTPGDLARLLPEGAVHQGAGILTGALPDLGLEDVVETEPGPDIRRRTIVVLDQVSDPRNFGAILRSAAAFDAIAVVTTDRHSAPVTGVLAKAASGALETVPIVAVTNLARALDQLAEMGFWRIGLDSHGGVALGDDLPGRDIALVLGAEGAGLRRLTRERCDLIARLPISGKVESLNVSAAASVALYELSRER